MERNLDLFREASEWFARFDGDEMTAEDRQRFEAWRRVNPDHERAFQEVRAMWHAPEFTAALSTVIPDVRRDPPPPGSSRPGIRNRIPAFATAAVLLLTTVWLLTADILTTLRSDYRTTTGEQRTIQLSDQSFVTLNTNTALIADLSGEVRRIQLLKGEALFRVSQDPDRPFTVEHKGNLVRVLGTEFTVRERQDSISVAVVRGKVEVRSMRGSDHVTHLIGGEQVFAGPDGMSARQPVDPADLTAWTAKRLAVTDMPLADLIQELQRYHPGYLWLWNPAIGRVRVTGIYDLSDTMETLTVLARTLPIRVDRLTDYLVVLR